MYIYILLIYIYIHTNIIYMSIYICIYLLCIYKYIFAGVHPLVGWLNPHMLHRNSPGWSLWFQRPIGLGLQLQGRRPPSYKLIFNLMNYSYTKLYLPILVVGDIYTNLAITWGPYLVPLKSMCPRSFPRRQGAVCTKEMPDSPWAVQQCIITGTLAVWFHEKHHSTLNIIQSIQL